MLGYFGALFQHLVGIMMLELPRYNESEGPVFFRNNRHSNLGIQQILVITETTGTSKFVLINRSHLHVG